MKQLLIFLTFVIFSLRIANAKNESKESTPTNIEIKVHEYDVKIIRRASKILSTQSLWNNKDNRECPHKAKVFSLYCALYKASVDINGEFDHRLAALEEIRRTVEEFSKGKNYEHRLMDYNNDPTTSFGDIKKVLKTTEDRLMARIHK